MKELNAKELNVVGSIDNIGNWVIRNQKLLIDYAVNIVFAIIILIAGCLLAKFFSRTINRLMKTRGVEVTVANFLSALIRYGVLAVTIIAVLGRVGVQTTSVVAVLGAAGLAIGLALQGSLSNFAAGVLLVVFRPFRVGDYITVGGQTGTVKDIQIFSTTLLSNDNKVIVIPNGKVIADNIVNYSREAKRRVDIVISVAYEADIDVVKKVLNDVVSLDKRIMHDDGVTIRLNEMAASSLDFVVRVWTSNANYWPVYFDLMEDFKRALDANNIGIPYPQMDVHLYQVNKRDA